jgi:hypothetical protein
VLRGDLAREQEGAVEVHADDELEVVVGLLGDARVARDAGDVHDAVQPAAGFERARDGALQCDERFLAGAAGDDLVARGFEAPAVEIDQRDARAVCGQRRRDAQSDALRGAGDDVGLSGEGAVAKHAFHASLLLAKSDQAASRRGRMAARCAGSQSSASSHAE